MKKISFDQLQENLYYEKMSNGLDVYILPKKGFNKTYATFTTKYGSIDNHFVLLDEDEFVKVPDGIAHFLEHKLFEKEDGDVFQQFSKPRGIRQCLHFFYTDSLSFLKYDKCRTEFRNTHRFRPRSVFYGENG